MPKVFSAIASISDCYHHETLPATHQRFGPNQQALRTLCTHVPLLRTLGTNVPYLWPYQTLIKQNPHWYANYYGYGVLLLSLERLDEAAVQFREMLQIHKGHQLAHNRLAWALWKSGDFANAEREFHSAIYWAGVKQKPQAMFFTDLGWFFLNQKRWNDALVAFTSAQDEDPDYFGNYWGIGCALKGLGDYTGAADSLRIALEKEPNLELPASEEIPQLLNQCLQFL